jgi:hypothetical protein
VNLTLPIPASWPVVNRTPDGATVYEVYPSVTLTVEPLKPLPPDLKDWGDRIVLAGVQPSSYRVRNVEDLETENGWPVTLFTSDIIHPGSKQILERRLHALYLFVYHGGAAIVRSRSGDAFDVAIADVRAVLLKGAPDWRAGGALTFADLWDGLDITREVVPLRDRPEGPIAQEPNQVK